MTNTAVFSSCEYCLSEIEILIAAIRKPYFHVCLSDSCFEWFLERGIVFSSAQLFVIIIEEILRREREI